MESEQTEQGKGNKEKSDVQKHHVCTKPSSSVAPIASLKMFAENTPDCWLSWISNKIVGIILMPQMNNANSLEQTDFRSNLTRAVI